jgi:hypothetical protein
MKNSAEAERLCRITDRILAGIGIALIAAAVISILGTVGVYIIPLITGQEGYANGNFGTSLSLWDMKMQLAVLESDWHTLQVFVTIICVCVLGCIILGLCIIKKLRTILAEVRQRHPFSKSCIATVRHLAYLILVSGVICRLPGLCANYLMYRIFNIGTALAASPLISSVSFAPEFPGMSLIVVGVGLLVLLLAGVFEYGAWLQSEYDATL